MGLLDGHYDSLQTTVTLEEVRLLPPGNFPKPRLQSSAFKPFPPTLVTGLNYRNVLILNKGDNR